MTKQTCVDDSTGGQNIIDKGMFGNVDGDLKNYELVEVSSRDNFIGTIKDFIRCNDKSNRLCIVFNGHGVK